MKKRLFKKFLKNGELKDENKTKEKGFVTKEEFDMDTIISEFEKVVLQMAKDEGVTVYAVHGSFYTNSGVDKLADILQIAQLNFLSEYGILVPIGNEDCPIEDL